MKTFSLVLVAIGVVILPVLFPVFQFDKPTGKYLVGTKSFMLTDKTRQDALGNSSEGNRQLMVQVYYPAEPTAKKMDIYHQDISDLNKALSVAQGLPNFMLAHYTLVKTNAYTDGIPLNGSGKFPLLTFSHGMGSYSRQSTFQLVEMASHGYVIVSIEHTGDAAKTYFPNGTTVPFSPAEPIGADMNTVRYLDSHIPLWEEDVSFVLDTLALPTEDSNLKAITDSIDFDKIGSMGFSYGGATATQVLMKDDRIKAALDMDGALFGGPIPKEGIDKPYLLINSSASIQSFKNSSGSNQQSDEALYFAELHKKNQAVQGKHASAIVLPHTNHLSFTDLAAVSPLFKEPGGNAFDTYKEINRLALEFFDSYLKGNGSN